MIALDSQDPTLLEILDLAQRAPSVHNTQPWSWCTTEGELHLVADSDRRLDRADPQGRDQVISCGAALHHLRLAAAARGWRTSVRRLPDVFDDTHLATVVFEEQEPSPEEVELARWIPLRRTDRRRASSWPMPAGRLEAFAALATEHGARLVPFLSATGRNRVATMMREAALAQETDEEYAAEMRRWTEAHATEGVPATNRLAESSLTGSAEERWPAGTLEDTAGDDEDPGHAWALLCTSSDDALSRLRAGEALSAILLKAAAAGIVVVPMSQAVEVEGTRRLLREEVLDDSSCPQLLLRLGWRPPTPDPVPATPRRPAADVLVACRHQPRRTGSPFGEPDHDGDRA